MAVKPEKITSGDTWRHAWEFTDDAGAPVDLSGVTAVLHLRSADGIKAAEATTDAGRIVIDGAAGRVAMTMPASAMALPPGTYRHALRLTWPSSSGAEAVTDELEPEVLVITESLVRDGD